MYTLQQLSDLILSEPDAGTIVVLGVTVEKQPNDTPYTYPVIVTFPVDAVTGFVNGSPVKYRLESNQEWITVFPSDKSFVAGVIEFNVAKLFVGVSTVTSVAARLLTAK